MKREYEEAFTEVDEIFKIMPIDLLSKIPLQFRNVISENKAQDYKKEIKDPLEEEQLREETVVILGLIYRDFLASPEEREQLQLRDAEELRKIQQEMQEKYDIDNIFEKKKSQKKENAINTTELIVYKEESFLQKIFNLIKGIFKKNKF